MNTKPHIHTQPHIHQLARVLVVSMEVGGVSNEKLQTALSRLKQGVQVWLDGTAQSQLLYVTNTKRLVLFLVLFLSQMSQNPFFERLFRRVSNGYCFII